MLRSMAALFDVTLFKIKTYTLMTTKQIKQAIRSGQVVVLRDDPMSYIVLDLFGQPIVVSLKVDVPTRLATLSDKRKAIVKRI